MHPRGGLESAHDAINAFFLLYELFESEARVWWVFNHRAFLEALCIGDILRAEEGKEGGEELVRVDPLYMRAKRDISKSFSSLVSLGGLGPTGVIEYLGFEMSANTETAKMIRIMEEMSEGQEHGAEVAKTRAAVLMQYL